MMNIRFFVAAGSVALAVAAPASAAATKSCGSPTEGVYNLKAKHVGCKKARRVAKKYVGVLGKPDTTPFGYHCQRKDKSNGTWKVTCRKHRKVVKWHGSGVG